jgi:predicted  nucleic acid-binding Zn-ribbon protein
MMTINSDVGQAILQGIERLNARFDRVEARLDRVEARLDRLETRMEGVETRLDSQNARLDRMEARFDSRMSAIETAVAEIDVRLKTWPDMHFLAAAAKSQIVHLRDVKTDVVDIKVRMAEIYQAMATEPEIRNLRDEIAGFRERSVEFDVRIGTLENHLGLGTKGP